MEAELPWLKLPRLGELKKDGLEFSPVDEEEAAKSDAVIVPAALGVTFEFIADSLGHMFSESLQSKKMDWSLNNSFAQTLMEIIEEEAQWALPAKEVARHAQKNLIRSRYATHNRDDGESSKGSQKRKTLFYNNLSGLKL